MRLGDETRPATTMHPGQTWSLRVDSVPGSRVVFAVGLLPEAPDRGVVRLSVTADGRPVLSERLRASRRGRWLRRSFALDASGPVTLSFRARHSAGPEAGTPGGWIALGSPRLYRPADGGRRVLLWISQDALRADHLGAYGYHRPTSPWFDRFARRGVLFENAMASSSWTLPSLASQMTSLHPSFHGAVHENLAVRGTTLFEALAGAGFTVLGVSGNPYVSPAHGLARGFDALRITGARAQAASRLLEDVLSEWHGGDLALFIHFMDPHLPYVPPPPFDWKFDRGYSGTIRASTLFFKVHEHLTEADRNHIVALYDGEIAFNDAEIGSLVERLEARGLLDGAVIAYTADHGEGFLDHGHWSHGRTLYEELVHVPFALRVPGMAPRRISPPVSLVDLAPTLLEALGVSAPASFQGRSLLPLVRGGAVAEEVYAETIHDRERNQLLAVREGAFKYILSVPRGQEASPPILREELYDLAADRTERRNLVPARNPERLRRLALAYLSRARTEGGPGKPVDLDPETVDKLKAWGYLQ